MSYQRSWSSRKIHITADCDKWTKNFISMLLLFFFLTILWKFLYFVYAKALFSNKTEAIFNTNRLVQENYWENLFTKCLINFYQITSGYHCLLYKPVYQYLIHYLGFGSNDPRSSFYRWANWSLCAW